MTEARLQAETLAMPKAGKTLWGAVSPYFGPLLRSYMLLRQVFSVNEDVARAWFGLSFARTDAQSVRGSPPSSNAVELASTAALCEVLMANVNTDGKCLSMSDADLWFFGPESTERWLTAHLTSNCLRAAVQPLESLTYDAELHELLPYVLEAVIHQLGVASVADTYDFRKLRRNSGTVFTPTDVVDYIVRSCVSSDSKERVLDPAVGTGVFLRSVLRIKMREGLERENALDHLYGIDVNPLATIIAAFILANECTMRGLKERHPWEFWQIASRHLVTADATLLPPTVFPSTEGGFDVVIGNPPYSSVPLDEWAGTRTSHFATAPFSSSQKTWKWYPLFIEMIPWLTRDRSGRGGMVVPLSIGQSVDAQTKLLRTTMKESSGDWRVAFFDRTPDSLFGDDVKTRNAIVLWHADGGTARIATTDFIRWNSQNRTNLFDSLRYEEIRASLTQKLFPKLGDAEAVAAYEQITAEREHRSFRIRTMERPTDRELPSVKCATTAYNSLSLAVVDSMDTAQLEAFPHSHDIPCTSQRRAMILFACLASRLTYWLWRVEGDGFHVNAHFLKNLPYDIELLDDEYGKAIAESAERTWEEMRKRPTRSVNRGVVTISYAPPDRSKTLDKIDEILGDSLGLSRAFVHKLNDFKMATSTAGRAEKKDLGG